MPEDQNNEQVVEQAQSVERESQETEASSQQIDWESRYTNLQSDHTRASQEAAEYRQVVEALRSDDPAQRAQAAEALGLEFDEPEPEPLDDVEELRRELQEIKEWKTQETQAKQTAAQRQTEIDYMDTQFDALEKSEQRDLTDREVEMVAKLAQQTRDSEGRPDVQAAYKFALAYVDEFAPKRVASKKAAQVQAGRAGTKEYDRRNPEERAQRMAAVMDAQK